MVHLCPFSRLLSKKDGTINASTKKDTTYFDADFRIKFPTPKNRNFWSSRVLHKTRFME